MDVIHTRKAVATAIPPAVSAERQRFRARFPKAIRKFIDAASLV